DFAFDIHTNVGASCIGAQIKGRIVPIKEKLRNGDIVKIITAKNQKPKSDWLNIVTSTKARNKIKQCLREEQTKLARLGREELERKIKNWKLAITIDDAVVVLVKYYKTKGGMDLYGRIATEKIDIGEIKDVITRHLNNELFEAQQPAKPQAAISEPAKKQEQENDALIIDEKIRGIDYKFAKCCNPIMGDKIFGFTTINSGITIHRTDCPNAKRLRELYPYRVIDAKWREQAQGKFIASIRVVAEDSPGMVNRITEAISEDLKINIRSMNISPLREGRIGGTINIEVPSSSMAEAAVFTILRIKGVDKAHRITNN
ncbi:MAG: bifunctional (p)ppGpp synthetase/guanosine-3',5'-bis(diphosphate) 3'-pyrophosphohydrolase, partial [Tidjanibacter sp.]|nr:bifunctional (p)ppGpp synthetase/guanosine-3',5'-bis(diphosphate) 3'-pyrophosphohydrolase [Tidjanibacter sp.]